MKHIIGLFIITAGLLNGTSSASAQNYYTANNEYNYRAHHETPRPDYDRNDARYRYNDYETVIIRDREKLAHLTAHIQEDKFKMLNLVNRRDYRGAQHEAFDIMNDQKERNALLDHLYYDGNNWQVDRSRMNVYSDRAERAQFSRDINHDENELVEALIRNDFYQAQRIAEHINHDSYREGRNANRNWNRDRRN